MSTNTRQGKLLEIANLNLKEARQTYQLELATFSLQLAEDQVVDFTLQMQQSHQRIKQAHEAVVQAQEEVGRAHETSRVPHSGQKSKAQLLTPFQAFYENMKAELGAPSSFSAFSPFVESPLPTTAKSMEDLSPEEQRRVWAGIYNHFNDPEDSDEATMNDSAKAGSAKSSYKWQRQQAKADLSSLAHAEDNIQGRKHLPREKSKSSSSIDSEKRLILYKQKQIPKGNRSGRQESSFPHQDTRSVHEVRRISALEERKRIGQEQETASLKAEITSLRSQLREAYERQTRSSYFSAVSSDSDSDSDSSLLSSSTKLPSKRRAYRSRKERRVSSDRPVHPSSAVRALSYSESDPWCRVCGVATGRTESEKANFGDEDEDGEEVPLCAWCGASERK